MKIIHLSDLHIGKKVNGFAMLDDQKDILGKILNIVDDEQPDAVVLAGDIYDKYLPSGEAVNLLDDFLTALAGRKIRILMIGGNHDSIERLSFGARLMQAGGVHIAGGYNPENKAVELEDAYGKVDFYLLPFVKPIDVQRFFPDAEIKSYTDAVAVAVKNMKINENQRNVIVTHQFVTGADRSESEDISVGGADNVDASVFDSFDYVALGHLHRPQSVGKETIRYSGTPLKYSFSEVNDNKSFTVVELKEKGNTEIRTIPLIPLRNLREITGSYEELMLQKNYENTNTEDYLHITLTNEDEVYNAFAKLQTVYPNIMKLEYSNRKNRLTAHNPVTKPVESLSPVQLFRDFFVRQTGFSLSEEQEKQVNESIKKIWEDRA